MEKNQCFSKIKEDGRCRPRNVIGLMGVHPGAGVTYTSIIISFLWENLGKTALLECNRRGDFDLAEAFHWVKRKKTFLITILIFIKMQTLA